MSTGFNREGKNMHKRSAGNRKPEARVRGRQTHRDFEAVIARSLFEYLQTQAAACDPLRGERGSVLTDEDRTKAEKRLAMFRAWAKWVGRRLP